MTKEEFIAEIELQKERGQKLLEQVRQMHVGKNNYGNGMAVLGLPKMYYTPKEELEPVELEYDSWKCYVRDFLISVFEKDDVLVEEWNKCLQKPYRHDVSDRNWYEGEINKALNKLDSFVQRTRFRFKGKATSIDTDSLFSIMHPKIVELVEDRFNSGHYSDALIVALKEISVIVKERVIKATGKERDGSDLMRTAFKVDSPVIKLNSLSSKSEKDEQQGYCDLFAGAMEALRNPMSHANIQISKEESIHKLFFVSMLMYKLCPVSKE
ncbi:MAG: TIGR02391 family protein [Bacteroidales bacterium]|nr:TIGR02391 family protein [Bacteroidales bacterium]